VPQALGLSMRQTASSMAVGLRGYLGLFPWLLLLLFGIMELARRLGFEPPKEPIHELIFEEDRPQVLALTVLLACVVGPVAEELFFRHVLYGAIRRYLSRTLAMLASGALFSLTHTNLVGFLPITILGCLLANLYDRTGSIAAPVAVHMAHNTILMGFALVARELLGPG
jgi:membrane protease YdiL (CAAX protease family)